jgi:hypothetical protein
MGINRISAPGQAVLGFVVTFVRNGELYSVKRLFEGFHHFEDDLFMVVILNSREIQIGRKTSLASDNHFSKAGAAFEGQPSQNAALRQEL